MAFWLHTDESQSECNNNISAPQNSILFSSMWETLSSMCYARNSPISPPFVIKNLLTRLKCINEKKIKNIKLLFVDSPVSKTPLHKQLVLKLTLLSTFGTNRLAFDRTTFLHHNLASCIAKRMALICKIIVATKVLSPNVMCSEIVMGIFQLQCHI